MLVPAADVRELGGVRGGIEGLEAGNVGLRCGVPGVKRGVGKCLIGQKESDREFLGFDPYARHVVVHRLGTYQ